MVLPSLHEAFQSGRALSPRAPPIGHIVERSKVLELLQRRGMQKIVAHQCQLSQHIDEGDPLKKPTGFMSNVPDLLAAVDRQCFGKHGLCSWPQGGGTPSAWARRRSVQQSSKRSCAWPFSVGFARSSTQTGG